MHISTRKTFGKSRRIERARRHTSSTSWSLSTYNESIIHPYLSVALDGQDGKTYHIALDEADIHGLIEAFEKYKQDYPNYFGHQLVRRSS